MRFLKAGADVSLLAAKSIRVMVVDDSAVVRGLVSRQLAEDPQIDVACTASNGELALRELGRHVVDVVVLDIEMPVMDGITALPEILARHPDVRVIMASTLTRRNAEISLKALHLGASDYVAKPENGLASAEDFYRELVSKIKAITRQNPSATPRASSRIAVAAPAAPIAPAWARPPRACSPGRPAPDVLAIGASTGGPPALVRLFESLRGAVRQPILLTQHMPATFTALLAEQLARGGARPCAEAQDGEPIEAGRCYVAPGGWHMTVGRSGATPVIRLNQEPPESFCRPAVDPMLRSAAHVYGTGVLAVILTGMGADGARGCETVVRAGGRFIVQDEVTSVVWGMPGAAAATGLAEAVLPMGEIGPWLRRATEATR